MSAEVISAVTKFHQTEEDLKKMVESALEKEVSSFQAEELAGGLCNAVYGIMAEGKRYVIKVAPESNVKMMRHEANDLETEAKVLKILEQTTKVRAPKLIRYDASCTICRSPYIIMSHMEGKSLATMEERPSEEIVGKIKREMGVFTRQMCGLKSPVFGVPAIPETYTTSNYEFVCTLFEMLFADAKDRNVIIPNDGEREMRALLESQKEVLEEVKKPCYAHTDTWDGNLMVKEEKLEGLVDFAAVLYGDPLMSHDFHDFSKEPRREFLEGFSKTEFTKNERIRMSIYKVWQCLGMIVERGYRGYEDENRYDWVLGSFCEEVGHLKGLIQEK